MAFKAPYLYVFVFGICPRPHWVACIPPFSCFSSGCLSLLRRMGLGGAPILIFKRSEGGYGAKAAVEVAFSDVEGCGGT